MKGFTLIELLVSVAIFSIVMVMALGALLALSIADRRAETLKSGIDNLTFALDSMSRSIRTGQNYDCGTVGSVAPANCAGGGNYLAFLSSNGVETYYIFDAAQDGTSKCGQTTLPYGCIERSLSYDGGATWSTPIPITSPDIVVQNVGSLFHVTGALAGSSDTIQPKATITVNATVQITATQTTAVHMQTSATQRIYDQ
jgi:prepilin-type N-terminal cleavage/methylation domain-containing protein